MEYMQTHLCGAQFKAAYLITTETCSWSDNGNKEAIELRTFSLIKMSIGSEVIYLAAMVCLECRLGKWNSPLVISTLLETCWKYALRC